MAWRKVGDFHIAEEIVQDTFLQVYKHLAQLKNPNQFSGWMYVIASRLCLKWLQKNKNKSAMQSLEDTPVAEIEESSYTHYVSEQRLTESTERRHELVKKLLARLPESERTVVTLHFLGEMTAKEIGKLLGVSVNTIKSRLRRGRKRLQEQREELLVSETLGEHPIPCPRDRAYHGTGGSHETDTRSDRKAIGSVDGFWDRCGFCYFSARRE